MLSKGLFCSLQFYWTESETTACSLLHNHIFVF